MSKLYRTIFIILLVLLVGLNASLFLYSDKILAYFSTSSELESAESIMNAIDESDKKSVLDLKALESQKFKDLTEFSVDFSDFDATDVDFDSNGATGTEEVPTDFEVGNKNPFQPF